MYLSLIGKPTDEDLERYPALHLTGSCECDFLCLGLYSHIW